MQISKDWLISYFIIVIIGNITGIYSWISTWYIR